MGGVGGAGAVCVCVVCVWGCCLPPAFFIELFQGFHVFLPPFTFMSYLLTFVCIACLDSYLYSYYKIDLNYSGAPHFKLNLIATKKIGTAEGTFAIFLSHFIYLYSLRRGVVGNSKAPQTAIHVINVQLLFRCTVVNDCIVL